MAQKVFFVTSNRTKFEEAKKILGDFVELEQFDADLPEIQDIDSRAVVKAKLETALERHPSIDKSQDAIMVDDVSVGFSALGGLPGPLIKWFLKSMPLEGIHNMLEKLGDTSAEVSLLIGYAKNKADVHFFEGTVQGRIVAPRGNYFGWDPIFEPNGSDKTYAEMGREEKNKLSHRRLALDRLKEFLKRR